MIGCRPLTDEELSKIRSYLADNARNKALFILGIRSGFRISELLSLRFTDILAINGTIKPHITVARKHMKGKVRSRDVALHPEAREALAALLHSRKPDNDLLFPMSRIQAWHILKDCFKALGMEGKLATHSMRKTFAEKMYAHLDKDVCKLQKAMGHSNLNSTASYISFLNKEIDDAIVSVA